MPQQQRSYYVNGALINPGYYNTPMGRADIAAEQQADRSRKAREIGGTLERATQVVQRGSHVVTDAEREAARTALSAGTALIPLYESGILSEDQLGKSIADAVNGQQDRYQNLASINADAEAIMQLSSPAQMKKAAEDLVKKKGAGAVMRTPAGQRLFGATDKLKQQQQAAMQSYADKHFDGDMDYVTWDTERNTPMIDAETVRAKATFNTMKYHQEAPQRAAMEAMQKALTPQAPRMSDFKDSINGQVDIEQYNQASAQYYQQQLELVEAQSDPAKMREILSRRAAGPSGLSGLDNAIQEFITTTPIDPQAMDRKVQAGIAQPGWYIDAASGRAVRIDLDGEPAE